MISTFVLRARWCDRILCFVRVPCQNSKHWETRSLSIKLLSSRSSSKWVFMRSVSKLFCLGLALAAVFTTSACSYHQKEDSVSGDVQVQVPTYSQGQYQMSVMSLT